MLWWWWSRLSLYFRNVQFGAGADFLFEMKIDLPYVVRREEKAESTYFTVTNKTYLKDTSWYVCVYFQAESHCNIMMA